MTIEDPQRTTRWWSRTTRQWADNMRMVADLQSTLGPGAIRPEAARSWETLQWEMQNFLAVHVHPDLVAATIQELDELTDFVDRHPSPLGNDDRLAILETEVRRIGRAVRYIGRAIHDRHRTEATITQAVREQEEAIAACLLAIAEGEELPDGATETR